MNVNLANEIKRSQNKQAARDHLPHECVRVTSFSVSLLSIQRSRTCTTEITPAVWKPFWEIAETLRMELSALEQKCIDRGHILTMSPKGHPELDKQAKALNSRGA
jgi:hypothetical protein